MGSIGCWMSPSARMTAASGIGRRPATWLSCARSPSTSWAGTEHPGSACGRVASRPPGMTSTCALFWLDDFMRRPCPREVDGKSNEITAIPALLETLSLKNSIVTLDAMGCQKAIADRILERGADYLLVLKANHSKAFRAVKECCERHCFARGATAKPVFDAFDDRHGRLVRRRVFVCPQAASLEALRAWPGLRTVLAVETIRGVNGSGKVEAEIRYFLSSCGDDRKVLTQAIRRHWTIENGIHWVLDVTFREDDSRVRDRTAARNLALLRKVAITLISHGRTAQISMRARRKQ